MRSLPTLLLSSLLVLYAAPVGASTISLPHVFSNGTPADATQVNADFDTLVLESNNQDARIAAVEALGGDISDVGAGFGLTGGSASGGVSLAIDTGTIQRRITGTCSLGSVMYGIDQFGGAFCDPVGDSEITQLVAGTGLVGGGTALDVNFNVSDIGSSEIIDGTITDADVGTLDHGLLGGLGFDVHTPYLRRAGGAVSGNVTLNDNSVLSVGSLSATQGEYLGTLVTQGRVYVGNSTNYLSYPTGDFGSVQINGTGKNGSQGLFIDGAYGLRAGNTFLGLYDDVMQRWISFYSRGQHYQIMTPGSSAVALHVDANGDVGIGTHQPFDRLEVDGTGRFAGDLYAEGRLYVDNANDYLTYPTGDFGSVQVNGPGVGDWPGYSIGAQFTVTSATGTSGLLEWDDAINDGISWYQQGVFYQIRSPGAAAVDALQIDTSGSTYVGNLGMQLMGSLRHSGAAGNFHIDTYGGQIGLGMDGGSGGIVVGNGSAGYGSIRAATFGVPSDRRLKSEIARVEAVLPRLRGLDAYAFRLKSAPDAPRRLGLMAQEVEAVYPEVVSYDDRGFRLVDYSALVGPLVASARELALENDALRARAKMLVERQSELLERLAALELTDRHAN